MKVVGLAGSPRVGGNSDLLLDQWLAGAKSSGADVEKVYLDRLSINPCRACSACRRPGAPGCVVKDDMQSLYDKLVAADVWVLATPVYFWGPSAQLKLVVDRWYGLLRKHDFSRKRASLIVTMGDDAPKTAHPTLEMFEDAFSYMKMKQLEPLVVTAMEKGAVRNDIAALNKAYGLGKQCVSGV